MHSCWMLLKNQFKKNPTNVHCAPSSMDMGVGYNGHVYRQAGGTSCVNQHIFNSEMKNKKVIFKCRNLHFGGSEIKKIYFL